MTDAVHWKRVAAYRRLWLPNVLVWAALAMATLVLFANGQVDLAVHRRLFGSLTGERWPLKSMAIWEGLRDYGTLPAFATAVAALLYLVAAGCKRVAGTYRVHAFFLIVALVVGPGLIVNQGFKMNWGRPRPDQIREFGGWTEYRAPHQPGTRGTGRSFPCGHCSMGAYFSAFYLLLRRRKPRLAGWALAGSALFGGLIGLGRMAAGAHFLSDVIWSGLMVFGANTVLYYAVFNIPSWEDGTAAPLRIRGRRTGVPLLSAALVIVVGIGTLVATAHYHRNVQTVPCAAETAAVLEVAARACDVRVCFASRADIHGVFEGRGFGLPWSKLRTEVTTNDLPGQRLIRFAFRDRGWFSETDARWRLELPQQGVAQLTIAMIEGYVRVEAPPGGATPRLAIRMERGHISLAPAWKGRPVELPDHPVEVSFE